MVSAPLVASLTVFTFVLACALIWYLTRSSVLSEIRGPKSPSYIHGNLLQLFQGSVGQADFEWQSLYGDVVRFKTVFGGDQLLVADPRALRRILNTAPYRYPRQPNLRAISRMLNGEGITWAEGEDHKRQRKILLPGFGSSESRAFLGIFRGCAESMCAKWTDIVRDSTGQKATVNFPGWLSRATLDAIGQAAFNIRFEVLQNGGHSLERKFNNITNVFGCPSAQQIFVHAASKFLPTWVLEWMIKNVANARLENAREAKRETTEVARELVREKVDSLSLGRDDQDVFSLLVKANMDTEAKNKLTEDELLSQMRTILLAGHGTTSNTLSWIFLELARRPAMQSRLRDEIQTMKAAIKARGDTEFSMTDFDEMPYMTALIKEGLRYHPVVPHIHRIAGADDILPLSRPIVTKSNEAISAMAVPKGTRIVVSIAAYNRNKELWGEDAHEFNPDRWLNGVASEEKADRIGVYSNLMTFIGGARACLGWRFALIEIQTFLVEIIGKFELSTTERSERVFRGPGVLMVPFIEGESESGSQLPLVVSLVGRKNDTQDIEDG